MSSGMWRTNAQVFEPSLGTGVVRLVGAVDRSVLPCSFFHVHTTLTDDSVVVLHFNPGTMIHQDSIQAR